MTPKLLIGMAHYSDFDGVYFTIQSLRLHHPEVIPHIEVAVIDNNPTDPHGNAVRDLFGWIKDIPAHYIPYTETNGTAATRNLLFQIGTAPAVMCIDPHVLLAPSSVKRLIDWYDAHPDTEDLYQGPMLYDDLKNYATHFDNRWDGEMWGKWALAWHAENDGYVEVRDNQIFTLPDYQPTTKKALRPAGDDPNEEPFEIPAMGLGLFTCRRAAWLGFNSAFKGFGGEEHYIHEKYRQAGHKTLCLPFLKWLHRFGRPNGVPYNLQAWDKVRNYVIGHKELGLDLTPVHEHFVKTGKISEPNWKALLDGKDEPVSASGCGCNKAMAALTLEDAYNTAANTPSDINEHVPTLKELANQCEVVVEFGVRTGVSTTGLLAGQPKKLVSYDLNDSPQARALAAVKGDTDFEFEKGDSTQIEIPECDLLFIDTKHTGDHVYSELTKHHQKVRKWIAFHDVVIFGEKGEDGGPGLLAGIRRFLNEHREWVTIRFDRNNHGFMVISKDPKDKKPLPSTITMAANFAKAVAKHAADGLGQVDTETLRQRLEVCTLCEFRNGDRCSICGCPVEKKAAWRTESCPVVKWTAVAEQKEKTDV